MYLDTFTRGTVTDTVCTQGIGQNACPPGTPRAPEGVLTQKMSGGTKCGDGKTSVLLHTQGTLRR